MKRVSIQPTERTDFDFILVHFSSRGRTLYNLLIFICFFNNNKHVMCVCVWGVFELEGPFFGQSTKCKQNCSVCGCSWTQRRGTSLISAQMHCVWLTKSSDWKIRLGRGEADDCMLIARWMEWTKKTMRTTVSAEGVQRLRRSRQQPPEGSHRCNTVAVGWYVKVASASGWSST